MYKIYHYIIKLTQYFLSAIERLWINNSRLKVKSQIDKKNILIIGIYFSDKRNYATQLHKKFNNSYNHNVVQIWVGLGVGEMYDFTNFTYTEPKPKFTILNEILKDIDISQFDYLIVTDDDIVIPSSFIDGYIEVVDAVGFSLSQPSRSHFSELSHAITKVKKNCIARQTRFVEIGPLFMVQKKLFELLIPFDDITPMGWGVDFVWPAILKKYNMKMGIVDSISINHGMRETGISYNKIQHKKIMAEYLNNIEHLSREEAFVVIDCIHK
jgi:hypothetical protein